MKYLTSVALGWMLVHGMAPGLWAQAPAAPLAEGVPLRPPGELDQLVAPIALYPDPLIAELLPAATQPSQLVLADRFLTEGGDINSVDLQPWDPSVRALVRYPDVLRWMDSNLAWTTEMGQAFLYQPADVMNAIQRLRAQALSLGNLQSTSQQTVLSENGVIEIVPANPQIVYVPVYQPEVVYVQRPPQPGAFISFGIGWPIGLWLNHDFDWHRHQVIVWHRDHPRPPDWWRLPPSRRPIDIDRDHVGIWRPRPRGPLLDRDRESRGWGSTPGRSPGRGPAVERPPSRPVGRPGEPRPPERPAVLPAPIERPPSAPPRSEPRPDPRPPQAPRNIGPAASPARPLPARTEIAPSPRPSTGALIGVQSAPETRQFSVRGQQSRGVTPTPPQRVTPPSTPQRVVPPAGPVPVRQFPEKGVVDETKRLSQAVETNISYLAI